MAIDKQIINSIGPNSSLWHSWPVPMTGCGLMQCVQIPLGSVICHWGYVYTVFKEISRTKP